MRSELKQRLCRLVPGFLLGCLLGLVLPCFSQDGSVTLRVAVVNTSSATHIGTKACESSNVVIWLSPADNAAADPPPLPAAPPTAQLVQRNKHFEPHLLVVRVGTVVRFPNRDPFFHNIFSLYDGKPFDLGLYESGTTRTVRFDRPGPSFLFCNIHAEMSAVVVAVDTPYFAVSDCSGTVRLRDVPDGRYVMHVWFERSQPAELQALTRTVTISQNSRTLAPLKVPVDPTLNLTHKNKYGQDYVPPPNPGYLQP